MSTCCCLSREAHAQIHECWFCGLHRPTPTGTPEPAVEQLVREIAAEAVRPMEGHPLQFDIALEMATTNVAARVLPLLRRFVEERDKQAGDVADSLAAEVDGLRRMLEDKTVRTLEAEALAADLRAEVEHLSGRRARQALTIEQYRQALDEEKTRRRETVAMVADLQTQLDSAKGLLRRMYPWLDDAHWCRDEIDAFLAAPAEARPGICTEHGGYCGHINRAPVSHGHAEGPHTPDCVARYGPDEGGACCSPEPPQERHKFVLPHGKGDTCAYWSPNRKPLGYCGKTADDPIHEKVYPFVCPTLGCNKWAHHPEPCYGAWARPCNDSPATHGDRHAFVERKRCCHYCHEGGCGKPASDPVHECQDGKRFGGHLGPCHPPAPPPEPALCFCCRKPMPRGIIGLYCLPCCEHDERCGG